MTFAPIVYEDLTCNESCPNVRHRGEVLSHKNRALVVRGNNAKSRVVTNGNLSVLVLRYEHPDFCM